MAVDATRMTTGSGRVEAAAALIRRLTIHRFRGIKHLVWWPKPGLNVILGGGDVGKTTILDAIALLLSPTNSTVLSDSDYWDRSVDAGFVIEAVMSLPEGCGIGDQKKNAWPWEWDGKEPKLPSVDREPSTTPPSEPVYRVRACGTADFDLSFEVVQPDETTEHFSVAVRRKIGLVRLSGDDRNDRDLRLVQGSALDRLVSDKTLRSRLGKQLADADVEGALKQDAKARLATLNAAFSKRQLPGGLGMGLVGGQGLSLNALVGLTATKDKAKLPLTSWGAGTRRLAALEIAGVPEGEFPITVVDEAERGLEPYRQRTLVLELQNEGSQVFLTTHSPAVLAAASKASVWYMDLAGVIGGVPATLAQHQARDPEAFLAKLTIVAEGPTEIGFVRYLLERALKVDLVSCGVWITNAEGNDSALTLLEGLSASGLQFAAFADDEGRCPGKWAAVKGKLGDLCFRWTTGCLEENVIQFVEQDQFESFIADVDGDSGDRRRTLAERLGIQEKDFKTIAGKASDLTKLVIEAATGVVPDGYKETEAGGKKSLKKHERHWFKSVAGGRELAEKVFVFGLWPKLEKQLLPFIKAVGKALALPQITGVS